MRTPIHHQYLAPTPEGHVLTTITEVPDYHSGIVAQLAIPLATGRLRFTTGATDAMIDAFGTMGNLDCHTFLLSHACGFWDGCPSRTRRTPWKRY